MVPWSSRSNGLCETSGEWVKKQSYLNDMPSVKYRNQGPSL